MLRHYREDKFTASGGRPEAFETSRDVNGLQYELQFTETKRAAERKRAEQLAAELGGVRAELDRVRASLGAAGKAAGAGAASPKGAAAHRAALHAWGDENAGQA